MLAFEVFIERLIRILLLDVCIHLTYINIDSYRQFLLKGIIQIIFMSISLPGQFDSTLQNPNFCMNIISLLNENRTIETVGSIKKFNGQ